MSIPIPVSMQASRLEKYGINENLKPAFDKIKEECKVMATKIKQDKLMVGYYTDKYKAGKLKLDSKETSFNIAELMRRRATKKELKALKKLTKKKKLDIKLNKMKYKKLVAQRKNIRNMIKETYNNNKNLIKDIKDDKKRQRREKFINAGIKIKDTTMNIKDKFMPNDNREHNNNREPYDNRQQNEPYDNRQQNEPFDNWKQDDNKEQYDGER